MTDELARLKALDQKGRELLGQGEFAEAAAVFETICQVAPEPTPLNNLATAYYADGQVEKALAILRPNLEPDAPLNPYAHGLAAQVLAALGREDEARAQLREAVREFEAGLADQRRAGGVPQFWKEYTGAIMRAAASLEDHRQVYDLYRRWDNWHVAWECHYLAGVAAFNLGRYARAARCWGRAGRKVPLLQAMARVAAVAERGDIPPFALEYDLPTSEYLEQLFSAAAKAEAETKAGARVGAEAGEAVGQPGSEAMKGKAPESGFAASGILRLYLLTLILEPEAEEGLIERAVHVLVTGAGAWGRELGEAVLAARTFPDAAKFAAAGALVDHGVYRPDEPIPMTLGGRQTKLRIKEVTISNEPDEVAQKVLERARQLRASGKHREALDLLENLEREGRLCAPALSMQANLYRTLGRPEEGRRLLEVLEKAFPGEPTVLFNLIGVWMELGKRERARSYLTQLEEVLEGQDLPVEFAEKLGWLRQVMDELILEPDELLNVVSEDWREEVADKPLPVDASLARVLKNMPAIWLDGVCAARGIVPARRRREREKQIAAYLTDPTNLEKVVGALDGACVALLRYLLEGGGWRRINGVTRRFGSMEGDGYFWNEESPTSPSGVLWSCALVGVGRAELGGRQCRVITVPVELRPLLSAILG